MKFLLGVAVGMVLAWWMLASACTTVIELVEQPQAFDLDKAIKSGGLTIDQSGPGLGHYGDYWTNNRLEVLK